jgi:hypothetical protein
LGVNTYYSRENFLQNSQICSTTWNIPCYSTQWSKGSSITRYVCCHLHGRCWSRNSLSIE